MTESWLRTTKSGLGTTEGWLGTTKSGLGTTEGWLGTTVIRPGTTELISYRFADEFQPDGVGGVELFKGRAVDVEHCRDGAVADQRDDDLGT